MGIPSCSLEEDMDTVPATIPMIVMEEVLLTSKHDMSTGIEGIMCEDEESLANDEPHGLDDLPMHDIIEHPVPVHVEGEGDVIASGSKGVVLILSHS